MPPLEPKAPIAAKKAGTKVAASKAAAEAARAGAAKAKGQAEAQNKAEGAKKPPGFQKGFLFPSPVKATTGAGPWCSACPAGGAWCHPL